MTDEEKSEKFVKENCCEFCVNKDDCEMGYIDCNTKEGVLYGLTEGRKEKETDIFDRWCREEGNECQFLEKLVKENEQLKSQIENLEKDKEQIIFETDLKIKALEDEIQRLCSKGATVIKLKGGD